MNCGWLAVVLRDELPLPFHPGRSKQVANCSKGQSSWAVFPEYMHSFGALTMLLKKFSKIYDNAERKKKVDVHFKRGAAAASLIVAYM
jgi:hypothetical protein